MAAGAEHLAYPATDGEKWIDVDLSRHTMTAYVGAKVVYGPVKMVNGSDLKPTVVGTFHVYIKRELQTMRGSNADGTKYETPDVPWISYFHNGFALHGAPWRSSFGYAGSAARTAASTCRSRWPSGSSTSRPSAPRSPPTTERRPGHLPVPAGDGPGPLSVARHTVGACVRRPTSSARWHPSRSISEYTPER